MLRNREQMNCSQGRRPYLRIETVLKVSKNKDKTDDTDKHSF